MTNKEKLEIINKKLDFLYIKLDIKFATDKENKLISQAIYNLESTKLLLEPECKIDLKEIYDNMK